MTSRLLRRLVTVLAASAVLTVTSFTLAGSAGASTPEGWEQGDPVEPIHTLLVLGGIPLLLFVVIGLAVYLPSMMRGESIAPGTPSTEDAWLGGPRKSAGELAGPDDAGSDAGGAGTTW